MLKIPKISTKVKFSIESSAMIFLLVFFLVAFPKGGFKINGAPITWGYLLIALVAMIGFMKLFKARTLPKINLYILLFMLPFQLILCFAFLLYGYTDRGHLLSIILNFIIFPFVFLVLFNTFKKINLGFLLKILKWSIFFTAIYGIALFVYVVFTGDFFEIPYLSKNMDDDDILNSKFIDRGGGIFKLISTYNNGNVYGASIIILLPLYCFLEKSKFRILMVKLALVLTLSRTVWIGMILFEFMNLFIQRKIKFWKIAYFCISGALIFAVILWFIDTSGLNLLFLFDSSLGGRSELLNTLDDIKLFANGPISLIAEIVYLSILDSYELFGLIAFIFGLFSPVLFYFFKIVPQVKSEFKKSIAMGMVLYLIIACSDGAINYIPVMCFYWFCVFLLVKRYSYVNRQCMEGIALVYPVKRRGLT